MYRMYTRHCAYAWDPLHFGFACGLQELFGWPGDVKT